MSEDTSGAATVTGVDDVTAERPRGRRAAPRRRRGRRVWIVAAALVSLAVAAVLLLRGCGPAELSQVRVVAAGDMACDPTDPKFNGGRGTGDWCQQQKTSDLAVALQPDLVLGLGDYQYELPTSAAYDEVYGPSWGRLKEVTRPALGNQEYKVYQANTFRSYFGDNAGPQEGYYSFDKGPWHVVVLNSNCTAVTGGCTEGSPQQRWLEQDLAATDKQCVVATWHHPRYSNGIIGPDQRTKDLWNTLVAHKVEMVLSGHEADYERFPTMDEKGRNSATGTRQFVVGVGGQIHYEPGVGDAPWRRKLTPVNSEFADFGHNGVLELTLKDGSYDWAFHTTDGQVVDRGSDTCH